MPLATWRTQAICRGNVDWFPPESDLDAVSRLKGICGVCPVRVPCLEDALRHPPTNDGIGVFGGTTPSERKQIRRLRKETA